MNAGEFKKSYEAHLAMVERAVHGFNWEDSAAYANWCAQTYFYVCHSTRLLALCAGRTPLDRNDFHYRLTKHIKEESGHENLALKDVVSLGYKITDFPALPETAAFYQTQYYYIEHIHPFAFFGYIVMLEGAAVTVGEEINSRAGKAHGPNCLNFISVHAAEDQQHIKEALHFIAKMKPHEIEMVHENFVNSCRNYLAMLAACLETCRRPLKRAS